MNSSPNLNADGVIEANKLISGCGSMCTSGHIHSYMVDSLLGVWGPLHESTDQ